MFRAPGALGEGGRCSQPKRTQPGIAHHVHDEELIGQTDWNQLGPGAVGFPLGSEEPVPTGPVFPVLVAAMGGDPEDLAVQPGRPLEVGFGFLLRVDAEESVECGRVQGGSAPV